jgi:hypothetical protein
MKVSSRAPLRDHPGTGASPRYPVRTEFPMEAHEKNKRGSEGVDKDSSVLNEFKRLVEKSWRSVHGIRAALHDDPAHGYRIAFASLRLPG